MRLICRSSNTLPTLLTSLVISLFFVSVSAQNLPALTGNPATNNNIPNAGDQPSTSAASSIQPSSTGSPPPSSSSSSSPSPSSATATAKTTTGSSSDSKADSSSSSSSSTDSASSSTRTKPTITITRTGSTTSSATTTASVPTITGDPTITGGSSASGLPKDLPTLAGQYPDPTVPPTQNAPFMRHSTLPEGTVFIVVGAALGFFGVTIIVWRALVAWSLKRSVQRAALQRNVVDSKPLLRPNKGGFYTTRPGSTLSLDHLTSSGRPMPPGGNPKLPTRNSTLFFSPTARPSSTLDSPNNRVSSYLPSGYYASGNSAPGGPTGITHVGGGGAGGGGLPGDRSSTLGLSNLNAGGGAAHYSRSRTSVGPEQDSPGISPRRYEHPRRASQQLVDHPHGSSSTLNLNQTTGGRAPSVYLDDLFDHRDHALR